MPPSHSPLRFPNGVLCTLLLLLAFQGSLCLAADTIEWGKPVSNMQLGIAAPDDRSPRELQIFFKNTGGKVFNVYLGDIGPTPAYTFVFWATEIATGQEHQLFSFTPMGGPRILSVGLISPIIAEIPAGKTCKMDILFSQLIIMAGKSPSLEDLQRTGNYKVHASYELSSNEVNPPNGMRTQYPNLWSGKLSSDSVVLKKPKH